ncbi:MAG: hypothetical protein HZA16_11645 [Nitrospirae bacterium]|nr:hypothetical protein [Nitrospirota bacterium]
MAEMYDALDKYWGALGFKITHEQALNVVKEMDTRGSTGDQAAKELADAWAKWSSAARIRKNSLGADIGKLEDWRFPQIWESSKTKTTGLTKTERSKLLSPLTSYSERKALYEKAKSNWVNDLMGHIDRSRYFHEDTGKYFTDTEMLEFLSHAFKSITTHGLNRDPLKGLADRLSAERKIHLKNAESWYGIMTKYGERDLFSLMTSTIQKNAKDTAMLETLGPNPHQGFKAALAAAKQLDGSDKGVYRAQLYFDEINGAHNVPVSERGELFANTMLGIRQWIVSSKLGSLLLSQINDLSTYSAMATYNGLGMGKAIKFAVDSLNFTNEADKKSALRLGIASQTVINDVAQRYGETVKGVKLASRFANATIRLSGAQWWTDGMKRGYQLLIGFHLNDAVQHGLDSQDKHFQAMLKRYGIGVGEWEIIRKATAVEISGDQIITPAAIKMLATDPSIGGDPKRISAIRETAIKVAAMMHDEADIAIISPGARETALLKAGTKPGTVASEFMRNITLFKSFTLAMSTRVLPRIFSVDQMSGFRAGLAAQFTLGMIIAGAFSYQLKDLSKGRNPRNMETSEFWVAAALQSGGLGIFGDFLFADYNRFGGGLASTIGGPVVGTLDDFKKLTIDNAFEAIKGKETNIAAEAVSFLRNNLPVINLSYTKLGLDHLLFFTAQEASNPGYLRRMRKRVEEQNKISHWWRPDEGLPREFPNLESALGEGE